MLVLNRKAGEAIVIDGDIRIVVLSNDGRGVRLGIEAPAERVVLREELVKQVAEENRRAGAPEATTPWAELLPIKRSGEDPAV